MKSYRELMQQALDAFESGRAADRAEAMVVLRAALVTPPQREWVSLTDEDIAQACGFGEYTTASTRQTLIAIAQAINAKLKEKNT
jgi:hypothetical protein